MMAAIARLRDSSLWPMLWKEFRQMARDRFTVGMLVGLPSVQLLLFGYGIRTEVRHVPMVVVDQSGTQESRALATLLANTQNFDVASRAPGLREAEAERTGIRTRDQWLANMLSVSSIASLPDADREALAERLRELVPDVEYRWSIRTIAYWARLV